MEITRIGIVGSGSMGAEIAEVAALHGLGVILVEAVKENLERAVEGIKRSLQKLVEKKELDEKGKEGVLARIQLGLDLGALAPVEFVIETIPENEKSKVELFRTLESIVSPQTILASNSSLISITKLAQATKCPEKVVGLHFMMLPTSMKLVELVRGVQTSDATLQAADMLAKKMGKETVLSHDFPGFLVNRILFPMINEAVTLLYEGVGSKEDIDRAMKFGPNHPLGPLALADTIGLDVVLALLTNLQQEYGNPKYAPCPLLVKYVEAGYLGRKTGRGFYEY